MAARDDREGDALMTERRLESLYDILQGDGGHGFAEHHVEDVWHFGGVVGHESLGGLGDSLRVAGAQIGREKDVPVGLHLIVCDVEYVLHTIVGHVVTHGP